LVLPEKLSQPLAQPLQLDQISNATVRAVGQSVIACVLIDALFIIAYLTV
jgi:hypothetical protein